MSKKKYTIFETFVGAGGSHIGFKSEGFESKYVNDVCNECLETLLYNNPEIAKTAFVDNSSILNIDLEKISEKTGLKSKDLDVLFGGIVCKGFSLAGERSPNDERNYFYRKQLEIVEKFRPKISVIENVPGIQHAEVLKSGVSEEIKIKVDELWQNLENYKGQKANLRKNNKITKVFEDEGKRLRKEKEDFINYLHNNNYLISVFNDIEDRYRKLGYKVYKKLLNAASFGAATKRERILIIAIREDINIEYSFPNPTHIDDYLKNKYSEQYLNSNSYEKSKTVNDALLKIDYKKEDKDNIPMCHNLKTVERFKYIPEGKSIAEFIDELPQDLKISKFYSRGNTMRLAGNKPSPTLVPGHSNFPIHPKEHRSITVREAACITGFPLDYVFFGSHTKRCEQVGNAVPPPLAAAIAHSIKILLDEYYNNI